MGHTNSTPNLSLPQFVGSDKPTWLSDVNGAMLAIDAAYGTIEAQASSAAAAAAGAVTAAGAAQTAADAAATAAATAGTNASEALSTANNAATVALQAQTNVEAIKKPQYTNEVLVLGTTGDNVGFPRPALAVSGTVTRITPLGSTSETVSIPVSFSQTSEIAFFQADSNTQATIRAYCTTAQIEWTY